MSAVNVQVKPEQRVVVIEIRGRFDFSVHKDFRAVYKDGARTGMDYVVDMKHVDYIDSSALGMLLLLREQVIASGAKVMIRNCSPDILKILTIAQFQRLFDIQQAGA